MGAYEGLAPAVLGELRWRVEHSADAEHAVISQLEISEAGPADAGRVLQNRIEHRLKIAG